MSLLCRGTILEDYPRRISPDSASTVNGRRREQLQHSLLKLLVISHSVLGMLPVAGYKHEHWTSSSVFKEMMTTKLFYPCRNWEHNWLETTSLTKEKTHTITLTSCRTAGNTFNEEYSWVNRCMHFAWRNLPRYNNILVGYGTSLDPIVFIWPVFRKNNKLISNYVK